MDVVIIEDEDLAAESLENLLLKTGHDLTVIKRLESVKQALDWFKEHTCDLIFSDISLGDGESFEIFDKLNINTPIIFTTAFDHYAVQAFQFFAVDYLLKPYDKRKLNKAIEKYLNYKEPASKNKSHDFKDLLDHLRTMPASKPYQTRFLVSKGEELIPLNSEDIAYFMAENKSLFLCTTKGDTYLYDDTLSNLEQKLSPKDFFKLNRKFIVRHNSIKSIIKYSQNRLKVELHPSASVNFPILISSKNIQAFKEWLNN